MMVNIGLLLAQETWSETNGLLTQTGLAMNARRILLGSMVSFQD
jgi:hypothetical protein